MLEIGSIAPDLDLEDANGEALRLTGLLGSHVLVYFMRSASCPVCTAHARDLARRAEDFAEAGVRVLVAVPDGREAAAAWAARQERATGRALPFRVVTGRSGTPHEAVGLGRRVFGAMQQSGSVLVDRGGVVRHAHAATMPTAGYDRKGVAAAIEELRREAGRA